MNKKDFANFVKEKRRELNLTQEELAEKMNVSRTVISKWEGGVSYPDLETAQLLAKVVGVTPTELFDQSSINDDKHSINPAFIIAPIVALIVLAGLIIIPRATNDKGIVPGESQNQTIVQNETSVPPESSGFMEKVPFCIIDVIDGKMTYANYDMTGSTAPIVKYLYNTADGQKEPTQVPNGVDWDVYEAIYRAINGKKVMGSWDAIQPNYTVYFEDGDGNRKYTFGISESSNFIMVGDGKTTIGVVPATKEEIKRIMNACVPLGVADAELVPLYNKCPAYFNLPTDEGLTVLVWSFGKGAYSCGLTTGTYEYSSNKTAFTGKYIGKDELSSVTLSNKTIGLSFQNASIEEMKKILATYQSDVKISIVPAYNGLSSYMYEIDDEYIAAINKLFE